MFLSLLAPSSVLVQEQPLVEKQGINRAYIGLAPQASADIQEALSHIPLLHNCIDIQGLFVNVPHDTLKVCKCGLVSHWYSRPGRLLAEQWYFIVAY